MKKKSIGETPNMDMEWEHQQNHDTVMKAMEIMADPEKMKHVHRISGKKSKAIRSIKDLHAKLQEVGKEENEKE